MMRYKRIKILYVEDEKNVREMLARFISRFCGELYVGENGEEGLALYSKHKVDIVISDIKMPKMNGIEMVETIKKKNQRQLVIFTTAHIDSEYLFRAVELQVDGYIAKPVDFDKLKFRIEKCINEIESKKAAEQLKESEEKFRKISQTAQMGIFIYKEKFVYVNSAMCNILGYSEEEMLNMEPWTIVPQEIQEKFKKIAFRRIAGDYFPATYSDILLVRKDATEITVRIGADTIPQDGGYAGLGTVIDITDILHIQNRLKQLAQAIEQMDEMVRISDKEGYIMYVNEALTRYTGYKKSELIGKSNKIFKSGEHSDSFYQKMYETIHKRKSFQATFVNAKKNGEHYHEDQIISPILNEESGEIEYFVSTSKDVTEHVQMQEKMKVLATTDLLTGIKNRYSMNQHITNEMNRIKRYGSSFALMMLDIDFFKKVNDTYGHDVGDYILKEFSTIVEKTIRDTDVFARWGGEEFLVLAPGENTKGAKALAEKIRKNVYEYDFNTVGNITISIGLSVCNSFSDKEKLLKNIDDALYEAKENGRNRVVFYKCTCAEAC
ncbi:MAG: diguanylate cyclase [Sulfurimonas sp.]|nr:diguanylate cyclase [Sulfurimonas sp.]